MENKATKATILYHKFFVYLPPLLIIFLIAMIYVSYCVNYLAPLLLDYPTEREQIKSLIKYPFELSSSSQTSFTKGLVLGIFTTFFLVILLICLLRTVFSDPGKFPNPLDLEFQIVMKNLLHEQQKKNSSPSSLNSNIKNDEDNNYKINKGNKINKDEFEIDIEKEVLKLNRNSKDKSEKYSGNNNNQLNLNFHNKGFDLINKKNAENNNENSISNNYFTEDSIHKSKDDPHNIVHFRNNIEEAPICYEEYTKRTLFLDKWQYKPNHKINEDEFCSKVENNNLTINKKNAQASLDHNNPNTKSIVSNNYNNKKNQSLKINNKTSYLSVDSTTQNMSNINAFELVEGEGADNYNAKNKKSALENQNFSNSALEAQFEGYVGYDVGKAFLCGTCVRIKVERSHHCKQCGKCVLKMDHHCPWLANCIGYANYKFFLLSHLYGMITSLFVLGSYWETIFNNIFDYESSVIKLAWNMFVYVNAVGLFSFLTWLFWVNWTLMFQGLTVIENADRERFPNARFTNQYDLGLYKNFVSVFGESPLIWFLPIMPDDKYKGIYFEKINKKEEKLMSYI